MLKTVRIHTLKDMLALSPEEFTRMLPDLCEWFRFAKECPPPDGLGVTNEGFTWADDGQTGITGVDFIGPDGERITELSC